MKYDIFSSKTEFDRVTLSDDGFIKINTKANRTLWRRPFFNDSFLEQNDDHVIPFHFKPFTLQLDNNGSLYINDGNMNVVWSLNGELMKYELTSDNALKVGEYILSKNSKGDPFLFKNLNLCSHLLSS